MNVAQVAQVAQIALGVFLAQFGLVVCGIALAAGAYLLILQMEKKKKL